MPALTEPVIGKGAELYRETTEGSPSSFQKIPRLLDIPETPASTADLVETTDHDAGENKEYILGLADGNEITCTFNYVGETQQDALNDDKRDKVARGFRLVLPQFSPELTCDFTALVREWKILTPINEAIKLQVVLKITGDPDWSNFS